ncbi:hypothetical protein D3C79_554720 [compost metagenome]
MRQVAAQGCGQARVAHRLAKGGEAADQPQRAEGLATQDVQGPVTVGAVEQREGDHADGREAGAHDQGVGQDHGQRLAQRRRQGEAQVHGEDQGHQPRPEFAQGETHQVPGPRVLGQFFGQAEAHPHTVADPVEGIGQQAPHGDDRGKTKQDRWPLVHRHHQFGQFVLGLVDFRRPATERAGIAAELLFEIMQGAADQAEYTLLDGGLRLLAGVAQFLQVGQQLGPLLVVFQVLDHLVQRLAQRLAGFGLGSAAGAEQAGQASGLHRGDEQEQQQEQATQEGRHREIYLRSND